MRAWINKQLHDPTAVLHGLGVVMIAGETVRHWVTGAPMEASVISTAFGCIAGGIVQDRINTPPSGAA